MFEVVSSIRYTQFDNMEQEIAQIFYELENIRRRTESIGDLSRVNLSSRRRNAVILADLQFENTLPCPNSSTGQF